VGLTRDWGMVDIGWLELYGKRRIIRSRANFWLGVYLVNKNGAVMVIF